MKHPSQHGNNFSFPLLAWYSPLHFLSLSLSVAQRTRVDLPSLPNYLICIVLAKQTLQKEILMGISPVPKDLVPEEFSELANHSWASCWVA